MNIRFLTVTLAAITAYALGACTVESSGSTSTGDTSTASATATGTGGSGGGATGTGGAATGSGGNGGSGGDSTACDPAYTCAEASAPSSGNPAKLCEGPAKTLFTAFSNCACMGACATACADSACKDNDPSTPRKVCLSDAAAGCGKELSA